MKKIVIIDDEEDFCFFIKRNLEATGKFEVKVSSNPKEGLKLAQSAHPDLVLLDILMPELSGTQIAEILKNSDDTKDIPIVFVTAVITEEETDIKGNFIKGNHVLAKPIKMSHLLRIVTILTETNSSQPA